jgi:hypothetical protein
LQGLRRAFTRAEAAEIAANEAEKSIRVPGIEPLYKPSPESDDSEAMVPVTPPRPAGEAQLAGWSQGVTTLALPTPRRLRLVPDLALRVPPPRGNEPA